MKVIGITGDVGSGKGWVLGIPEREYGAQVIQTDLVAGEPMELGGAGYERLVVLYEGRISAINRTIDHPRMATLVFHDDKMPQTVNDITHPLVWTSIRRQIEGSDSELVVVEAVLPDEDHRDVYTELWYVYTSEKNRIVRLLGGCGYSREKTRGVMDSQLLEEEFRRMADVVADSNGSLEDTGRQTALLLK